MNTNITPARKKSPSIDSIPSAEYDCGKSMFVLTMDDSDVFMSWNQACGETRAWAYPVSGT